jgi:hypothetical protein
MLFLRTFSLLVLAALKITQYAHTIINKGRMKHKVTMKIVNVMSFESLLVDTAVHASFVLWNSYLFHPNNGGMEQQTAKIQTEAIISVHRLLVMCME